MRRPAAFKETAVDFLPRTLAFYILSHAFLFWHFSRIPGGKRVLYCLAPWFICMGLFPFVFSLLPHGAAQQVFAKAGSVWLPFAFFSLVVFALADTAALLIFGIRRLLGVSLPSPARVKRYIAILLVAAACVYGYGIYEARRLTIAAVTLATDKLPPGTDRVRIAFAADLHIGPQTGTAHLSKSIDLIMAQNPDVILLGGDLLDDAVQGAPEHLAELARLAAPLGVFAVLGNHDTFGGYERAAATVRRTGVTLLENQTVSAGPLTIIGVDDPDVTTQKRAKGQDRADAEPDVMALLRAAPPESFTILLDHRPTLRPESVGYFDLQLSGHSHGGQIIMLAPLLEEAHGTPTGLSDHTSPAGKSTLYVTTGTGYSKLPIRLGVPPEIVSIDITRQ